MPEKIFTIPINEAFETIDGCPMCRLRAKLSEQTLSFTLGAAMMEPAVRIDMNKQGFCALHLDRLHSMKNKLSLSLIMESHLDELLALLDAEPAGGKRGMFSSKSSQLSDCREGFEEVSHDCFVCRRIKATEKRYFSNVVYLWGSDKSFQTKLTSQPYFCIKHFTGILSVAAQELKSAQYESLYTAMTTLESKYIRSLRAAVTEFNISFDHRSADKPLSQSARSALDDCKKLLK